jgi:hypothetical protein
MLNQANDYGSCTLISIAIASEPRVPFIKIAGFTLRWIIPINKLLPAAVGGALYLLASRHKREKRATDCISAYKGAISFIRVKWLFENCSDSFL